MELVDPTISDEPNELGTTAITEGVTPVLIPADRYRTTEWDDLERERLWPSTWTPACSVDHIPEPGDFFEYRLGELSIIIVRGDDGVLRGFQNACRHRGNTICEGSGSVTELRCTYHRWSWDLEGTLVEVPSRKGFGPGLKNERFGLFPAQVDTWGPFVFVNPDVNAVPLAEYLEAVPDDCAWANIDEFRCSSSITIPVNSNWKVVSEGFSETYHVQGAHKELLAAMDDVHAPQQLWGLHGVSHQQYAVPSPRIRNATSEVAWKGFTDTQGGRMGLDVGAPMPEIPEGSTIADVVADLIRAHQADDGVDLSAYENSQITGMSQYNLFPNSTVLMSGDMMSMLIGRPGETPHDAMFTLMSFKRVAPGADHPKAQDHVIPADTDLGLVIGQDIEILRMAQRGLRQPGLTHLAVGSEECRIINLHRNLEKWLGIYPTQLEPI